MTNWHVAFFIIKIFIQVWLVQFTCETVNIFCFSTPYQDLFSFSNISMYYSLFHWITCGNHGLNILNLQWHFLFTGIIGFCFWMDTIYIYIIWTTILSLFYNLYFIFLKFILHFYPFFFFCLYISWIKQKY